MASNWFGGRQPFAGPQTSGLNYSPQQQQPPNQRASRIYGDDGVHFNENGRLIFPGQSSGDRERPTNMLFWRQGAPAVVDANPSAAAAAGNFRYRPWSRTVVSGPGAESAAAPIITRRVDRFGAPSARFAGDELPYTRNLPVSLPLIASPVPAVTKSYKTTMAPETIVIEEMRVYDKKPCCWQLFGVVGLLLLAVGITNVILCFQPHSYCLIWTGIFVIVFALVCAIHRGDYFQKKWKSWLVIIVGLLTTIVVSVCCYILLVDFCHQFLDISNFLNYFSFDYYVGVMKIRYTYFNTT